MPLPREMRDKLLTFNCPQCGHALIKNSAWFMAKARFKCAGCGQAVPIGYVDKIALFEQHDPLIDKRGLARLCQRSRHARGDGYLHS
jgi:predicted RNA-binding Zn-ribbon protein involved in translation (DUF1610 family)